MTLPIFACIVAYGSCGFILYNYLHTCCWRYSRMTCVLMAAAWPYVLLFRRVLL